MTSDRSTYVSSPLPIERELLLLFDAAARITIFDIGACEGEDAVRYSRLFPNAVVYAVEPVPDNVERIQATLAQHGVSTVNVLAYALSDTSGAAPMYVSSGTPPGHQPTEDWDYGNKSSSLLAPEGHLWVYPWVRFDATISVQTRRLDDVCAERRIQRLDFLHLDVQGAELMVLEGAGRWLAGVTGIWLEVEAVPLYLGQPLKGDVQRFLQSRGFKKVKDTVGPVSGDQLWVRAGDVRGLPVQWTEDDHRTLISRVRRWYRRILARPSS